MENVKPVIGTVVSIDDVTCTGKIKVVIPGYNDNIPVEELDWIPPKSYSVSSANGGGSLSVLKVGQQVRVYCKDDDESCMEWEGVSNMDPELQKELKNDYANSHVLLYDSGIGLSVKYQPMSGFSIYYQGSFIQITPDNTITLHYGEGATGTQIQLSDGRIDIQGSEEINLTTKGTINLEADNIVLNAKQQIQMSGNNPDCAVNGSALMTLLTYLGQLIDNKTPSTPMQGEGKVMMSGLNIYNNKIKYFNPA